MKTFRSRIAMMATLAALAGVNACSPAAKSPESASANSTMDHAAMANDMGAMSMPSPGNITLKPYKPYPYPFATSVVSGEKLGPNAVTFIEGDYEVRVLNAAEQATFKADTAKYLAKITEAYKDAKPNPLKVCPVCGMKIDEGSLPFVYEGRQFAICDKSELEDFQNDPDKYVKMWDDAAKAAATAAK